MAKKKETPTSKAPTRQMWWRSVIVLALLVVLCAGLVGKLSVLQIAQADTLREMASEQWVRDSPTSANRGSIYDANMTVLATSATVWTVIMSPLNIKDEETRQKIADDLSAMLSVDRDALYQKTLKVKSQYEIVKSKIEYALRETVSQWIQDNKLTNVFRIIQDYKRYYPLNNLASTVLGFTGTDNNGLYGLEAYYESTLAGKAGRIVTAKNALGGDMDITLKFEKTVDAESGNSLVLTIDNVVQYYLEKYLEIAVKEDGCNNRGTGIIMDVNTGAIVAMATKGDFDPNEPMTVSDSDLAAQIAQLAGDEQSAALKSARENQWVNKAISDFYDPGSVYKVFTGSMALEEGVVNDSWRYTCTGSLTVAPNTKPISCHKKTGHGTQTFAQALSNSCNPAFMTIGLTAGPKLYFQYFEGFGFNQRTGIDMLSESKVTSSLYFSEKALESRINLAVASFGQNFSVTPIQMITAISAVANGGKLMQPYVVQKVLDADGNILKTTEPVVKRQVISEATSKKMSELLAGAVNGGGSRNAYIAGYRMAGKTGTSEKTDHNIKTGKHDVVASFAGFAPADNPQYAILIMLDEPQIAENLRYGGTLAAPVAQKVMTEALPYLGIEPVYTEEERAALNRSTPDVTGKTVSVAQTMIQNSSLQSKVVGGGDTVIKQVPEKGESIPKNGIVVLYTSEDSLNKTTKVPNFKGMTVSQAKQAAETYQINLKMDGLQSDTGDAVATVSEQSVAEGTSVTLGEIITVTFVYKDEIR